VKLRLLVAYEGSSFHGFARNVDVETVQGALEDALSRVTQTEVATVGAGRTDAGVHAWGQVVSCEVPDGTDLGRLHHALNALLSPAIVVRALDEAAPDFDARHSARWRSYRYTIVNRPVADPFLARTAWWVPHELDLSSLRLAVDPLIGEHDFTSFCRRPDPLPDGTPRSLVREVQEASWHDLDDDILRFDIRANAFCHQMVRAIVGTLVDVGLGRRRAGEVRGILTARDRQAAGQLAPPEGLCLWEVGYDPSPEPGARTGGLA
jgi:tRNA pseudouridine38-40 synthase